MKCSKCGERESTGIMFTVCDPCFDEIEAQHNERLKANGGRPVRISDQEFRAWFGGKKEPGDMS